MVWGIYARVSTEEQASEGMSIDAQLSALHEHFRLKGLAVREYLDAGKSAWTEDLDKRPAFKSMRDDAFAGQLEGVGVTHLDRFSRKLIVTLTMLGEFGRRGIGFVSLENSAFDFSKPADRLLLAVLGAFAEYYSAELSRKIQRGLEKRAAKGKHVGLLPFGYCNRRCPGCKGTCERHTKDENEYKPEFHPEDHRGVRLAFETYRLGTFSDGMVARVLNAEGYRSRTRKGRVPFNKHSISHLLTNHFYTGKVRIGLGDGRVEEFPGVHEALISQELFDEVQAVRRKHCHRSSPFKARHRVYLFAGLLVCAGCGRKMRAAAYGRENQGRGYRCTAVESNQVSCDRPQGLVGADPLEAQFGEIVKQFHMPKDWRERVKQMIGENGDRHDVENERKAALQKLERIKWLYAEGDLNRRDYLREKANLESKLASMSAPREREILDAGAYLENLSAVWADASMEERKQMVLAMVLELVCDPWTKRLVSIKPKSSFVPLFRQCAQLRARDGVFEIAG